MTIDLTQIKQLTIQRNAVLLLPEEADQEIMRELAEALHKLHPRSNVLLIHGLDLQLLPESEMNAAGWYRK